ncbi:Calx-beta domain-containing protein [Phormidium sp. CCY1219]|uniref:Calx-beta domain-containing protein n=1 Tax=Phormidium sp. CCY1219 TaxID=2886104 RepID=UPI002D1F9478|nr:Calx-beta domain-containing protein [Phormidium sp. CCY1219]MEB3831794.1 hypothetical protein [Phormidium sp. CCY1219]
MTLLFGDNQDNTIIGGAQSDTILGGEGNDSLLGSSEDDILFGGADNDTLTGGSGADIFVIGFGEDTITDFVRGSDAFALQSGLNLDNISFAPIFQPTPGRGQPATRIGTEIIGNFDNNTVTLAQVFGPGGTSLDGSDFRTEEIEPVTSVIEFSNPTFNVTEGNSAVQVTLVRTGDVSGTVSATVVPANDSAIAPVDYDNSPISVTFAPGQTLQTVQIPIADDTQVEPSETFQLSLANPSGGAIFGDTDTASVTIDDNDVALEFSDPTFRVNENGTPIAEVTVVRTGVTDRAVGATLALDDDSAIAPDDFDNTPIPVTLAPGETTQTANVPIVDDEEIEPEEAIALELVNPTGGATIGDRNTAALTVVDNDLSVQFSQAEFRVNEDGTAIAPVTLTRTGLLDVPVGATVTLADGSAIAPADYNNAAIGINFAAGETQQTLEIPIVNDTSVEPNETLTLNLGNPTGGATLGAPDTATLTILDDDVALQFTRGNYTINEDGTTTLPVTIARLGVPTAPVSVTVNLTDNTAIAPQDYAATPIVANFAPGETTQTIEIPIVDDEEVEPTESLNLTLANPTAPATVIEPATASLEVIDNDAILEFATDNFVVNEDGTAIAPVTITRTGVVDIPLSASLLLADGSATSPEDYNNAPIAVNFAPGETTQIVNLPITDDAIAENSETVNLTLVNPTNAILGPQSNATLTILDNDSIIEFSDPLFNTAEDGTTSATITLTRTGGLQQSASATLTLSDGTASAIFDYNNAPIPVNFAPGETRKTLTIPIIDDSIIEGDETINLALTNPSNNTIIGTQSTANLLISRSDTPTLLNFEGVGNLNPVDGFYSDNGISFSGNGLGIIDTDDLHRLGFHDEFGGNFEGNPSGITALTYGEESSIVMNVSEGFDNQLSFFYASPFFEHTVTIYDDIGGSGNVLASVPLSTTPEGELPDAYGSFVPFNIPFAGVARSVSFGSVPNKLILDDILLG